MGHYCTFVPPLPIVIDDSLWKNEAESESFTIIALTLGGYESAIAPKCGQWVHLQCSEIKKKDITKINKCIKANKAEPFFKSLKCST